MIRQEKQNYNKKLEFMRERKNAPEWRRARKFKQQSINLMYKNPNYNKSYLFVFKIYDSDDKISKMLYPKILMKA